MTSSRISRVIKILTTLQSGKSHSVNELANVFGTSRRTVFRDLEELQAIGVPCRYDREIGGYAVDQEFFLPPIDLNLQEALSLLILTHKIRNQIQLPFKKSLLMATLKIGNNLPAKIQQYCNSTLQNISAQAIAQIQMSSLDKIFSELQTAILKHQKIMIQYNSFFEKKMVSINLEPYHLLFNKRTWYVLGFSPLHESVRTFKLSRILEIKPLNKCFLRKQKFDLQEHFGKAWSMIPEGKIYNVKLHFLPKVAGNVTEVLWHATQKVEKNLDGSAIVEYRVDGLQEITWWILGYGDQVEILAPQKLRNNIVKIAQNMIKLNNPPIRLRSGF